MAETMNVVVKEIVIRNCVKQIYVANGMIYNIVGYGESAGAQLTPIDEATDVELYNALGPDDIERWPLAASLGQMSDFTQYGEEEKYLLEHISPESEEAKTTDGVFPVLGKVVSDKEEPKNKNCENIGFDSSAYKVDSYFDSALDALTRCSGDDFLKLVRYAKSHGNTWHSDVVNADDAYCSALIKLARPLGESVEKKAFELFNEAIEKDEYDFIEFWKALQTINYFCN